MHEQGHDTAVSLQAHVAAMKQWTMAAFVASAIWASPAAMAPYYILQQNDHGNGQVQDNSIVSVMGIASAKEKASGSGSRVNKDPESLLRYGLPIQNKEVSLDTNKQRSLGTYHELAPTRVVLHCSRQHNSGP